MIQDLRDKTITGICFPAEEDGSRCYRLIMIQTTAGDLLGYLKQPISYITRMTGVIIPLNIYPCKILETSYSELGPMGPDPEDPGYGYTLNIITDRGMIKIRLESSSSDINEAMFIWPSDKNYHP